MINKNNSDIQNTVANLLGQNPQISNDIVKLISSLNQEDIKKISVLMKNQDLQKIANSIIDSKNKKG